MPTEPSGCDREGVGEVTAIQPVLWEKQWWTLHPSASQATTHVGDNAHQDISGASARRPSSSTFHTDTGHVHDISAWASEPLRAEDDEYKTAQGR